MKSVKKSDKILLKGGDIVDPVSRKHEKLDVAIIDGHIDKLGVIDEKSFSGKVIDVSGCWIVPGLIDMHVHLREPGREDEETVHSGCAAAMAGGFTAVCTMPNTSPACDNQNVVQFIKERARDELVDIFPIAAVTKNRAGKEITEMGELVKTGVVAFSDDGAPVVHSAVMRHALEYSSMYNVPIIDHCDDMNLFEGGHINEGKMSTWLGIPPIPDVGEEILIARDILLAKYTGGKVHIAHISTKGGVELVRRAKEERINVTCEVTPHHLALTEDALVSYDTNLKMNPPLRTAEDVDALKEGLKDGTIDAIASDHAPHSIEEKDVEFDAAPFGIIGLETMLGVINTKIVMDGIITLEQAIEKMCVSPRKILNLPIPGIAEGEHANLTIFDPKKSWTVNLRAFKSLSRNSPFGGWKLNGFVKSVVNKGIYWENLSI
ncbi:MAG: dihydroorotase [Calditrichaeota bacterium]|nr:dihydroorotase [Calditrichota bacterium]